MRANKDIVEAAFLAWNEISSGLDSQPTIFESVEDFEPFYKKLLATLIEEEDMQ